MSNTGTGSGCPEISVSQYRSPNRQMSLPETSDQDVTLPWLLSPKWYSTRPEGEPAGKRSTLPPQEALIQIRNLFFMFQVEFMFPALTFRDPSIGEAEFNRPYVEVLHQIKQLQSLLKELDALKVPEENEADKTKLQSMIRGEIDKVNRHIEEERQRSMGLPENTQLVQQDWDEKRQFHVTAEPAAELEVSRAECIIC